MKKSAKNRIIIWSIASVLLIGVLIAGIFCASNFPVFKLFSINSGDILPDWDGYKTASGNVDFASDDISKISVKWISGNVSIESSTDNKIEISETSSTDITEEKAMQYKLSSDGTLSIYSSKSISNFSFWSTDTSKNLVIKVPQNKMLHSFDISTTSADVEITSIKADETDFETTSGEITLNDITGENTEISSTSGKVDIDGNISGEISVDTVSGDLNVNSDCRKLNADSISGKISATLGNSISQTDASTVSGNISLSLPENINGFSADYSSVSGNFSCDFEGISNDNSFKYKNTGAEFNFDTVSGEMRIEKIK